MRRVLAVLTLTGLFLSAGALAEGKQDFTLVNKTGYRIEKVYVSPTKSDDWEEDVLGKRVLDDDERVDIAFNRKTKTCKWDLKVVYDDGTPATWYGFDLCNTSKIRIFYNHKTDETWAEYE